MANIAGGCLSEMNNPFRAPYFSDEGVSFVIEIPFKF